MTVNQHATTFAGLPVRKFKVSMDAPEDPAGTAWRLTTNYEGGPDKFNRRLDALLAAPWAGDVRALVIGEWGESYEETVPIDRLVAAAGTLTNLTALFVGDMTSEENEISWIKQDDVTPLLQAYPRLEVLRVRGADGLELTPLRHEALRELAFESGGLPAEMVQAVSECDLPALRHLELWLGTDDYGGDATVEDLAVIMAGSRWPQLTYLGLRDAEIVDMIAAALSGAPVVSRLSTLDLSLGVLSDVGAAALLAGQPLTHLRKLDLHHHFLSEEMMARLREELESAGVELDLDDAQEGEIDDRFIAVSE